SGLDPDNLELDITESMAIQNNQFIIPRLAAVSRLGVRLSMDDFGTGYSSLSSLKAFSIQTLKIDRSFVSGIGSGSDDAAIVEALITLGHSLKLRVIAEGVETDKQLSFLREHQCDAIQGYLFSQPLAAEDFEQLLTTDRRLSRS
ncbi:MAG: EAL domain-containing protein, partial [Nitrospiraceae bacterium]